MLNNQMVKIAYGPAAQVRLLRGSRLGRLSHAVLAAGFGSLLAVGAGPAMHAADAPPPANDAAAAKAGKEALAKAAAAAPAQKPLDNAAKALMKNLATAQKDVYGSRSPQGSATYFKAQWEILKSIPEFAEKGSAVRAQMAAEDKDTAAFLKENAASIDALTDLMQSFQQQLGLSNIKLAVPARMTAANPVPAKIVASDIALSGDPADKPPADVSRDLNDRDRKLIADFENYLKRLAWYDARKEWQNSERDWAGCASCYTGAYYFMLLVQQDPRYALTYPETYKFLKTMKSGKVVVPKDEPAGLAAAPAAGAKAGTADATPKDKKKDGAQ